MTEVIIPAPIQLMRLGIVPSRSGPVKITVLITMKRELAAWLEYVLMDFLFGFFSINNIEC